MNISGTPEISEYADFYSTYVSKVDSQDVVQFLADQLSAVKTTLSGLSEERASRVDPPYQWSIKQVIGHLIDGEKVFGYRLHRIACNDPTPMAGFEHEPYVENLDYSAVTLGALVQEFEHLRLANLMLLRRLPPGSELRKGTASDVEVTLRSQAFIIAGHVQHHFEIINKRLESH